MRWGQLRLAGEPTSPSPSLTRRVPSLSPRKRAERTIFDWNAAKRMATRAKIIPKLLWFP